MRAELRAADFACSLCAGGQVTESGSAYRLGERAPDTGGVRRSSRALAKESWLDAFADTVHEIEEVGLGFAVGGVDVGGSVAEKIMRDAFSVLDDNLLMLRAQYATARRVVLFKEGVPVAASVVEVHPDHAILEVPILAAARSQRQQGFGSVLVAVLIELGCRMKLHMLIVSATQESLRFWLRQGLHTAAHCTPVVRAALRKIDQSAYRGFANSISVAVRGSWLFRLLSSLFHASPLRP